MKNMMSEDKIKRIDFDSAFYETPPVVHKAVLKAQAEIARYEKRKRILRSSLTAVAACLLVVAAAAVFFMRTGGENSDYITPPVLSQSDVVVDMETPVFASRTDPYFHRGMECDLAYAESVELPLVTAIEFEKVACPACASDLQLNAQAEGPESGAGDSASAAGSFVAQAEGEDPSRSVQSDDPFKPVLIKGSGADVAYESIRSTGAKPDYTAGFFGGNLKVFRADDGSYIGVTDPSPDNEIFRYILVGVNESTAEEYYNENAGPGVYASYNPETKLLQASWGDDYEYHISYEWIIETAIVDEATGMLAWRMNDEQYQRFVKDAVLTVDSRIDSFQPALSAMLQPK